MNSKVSAKTMDFSGILERIGSFGKYQKIFLLVVSSVSLFNAMTTFVMNFSFGEHEHRCQVSDEDILYSPPGTVTVNTTNDVITFNVTECEIEVNGTFTACQRWVYDKTMFPETIISKFNIVCSDKFLRAHFLTAHFFGLLLASLLGGILSDILGRKPVLFVGILMLLVSMGLRPLVPYYTLVVVLELFNGMGSMLVYLGPFIILTEMVRHDKRVLANFAVYISYCAGNYILLLLAYFIRDWKHIFWAITVFIALYIFVMVFIPESPRWLLSRNRKREAVYILEKMAKTNGNKMVIPVDDIEVKDENRTSFLLFVRMMSKSKRLMLRLTVIAFNWFAISMMYYGIAINVAKFSGNVFANFAASSTAEVVAIVTCGLIGDRYSRKKFFVANMILGGGVCICTIFNQTYANESLMWLTTVLAMFGRYFNAVTFFTVYIITAELFPTVLRASVVGFSSMSGRIGSIFSSYIIELGSKSGVALPLIIFGGISLAAGLLAMTLPDPTSMSLPETINDAIKLRKHLNKNKEIGRAHV